MSVFFISSPIPQEHGGVCDQPLGEVKKLKENILFKFLNNYK